MDRREQYSLFFTLWISPISNMTNSVLDIESLESLDIFLQQCLRRFTIFFMLYSKRSCIILDTINFSISKSLQ